ATWRQRRLFAATASPEARELTIRGVFPWDNVHKCDRPRIVGLALKNRPAGILVKRGRAGLLFTGFESRLCLPQPHVPPAGSGSEGGWSGYSKPELRLPLAGLFPSGCEDIGFVSVGLQSGPQSQGRQQSAV